MKNKKIHKHAVKKKASKLPPFSWIILVIALPVLLWVATHTSGLFSRATFEQEPIFGSYMRLDNEGFDDTYVRAVPTTVLTVEPITVETWLKIPKPSSGSYIREYPIMMYTKPMSPADYGYILRMDAEVNEADGTFRPSFSALINNWTDVTNRHNSAVTATGNESYSPDVWHHIAAVAYGAGDNCYVNLFVDGRLTASARRFFTGCTISDQQPLELVIGRKLPGEGGINGFNLTAMIDEVRISRGILYESDFTPPALPFTDFSDPTLVLYHFNDNAPFITDSSGKNNNGTLIGTHFSYIPNTELPKILPTATPQPQAIPVIETDSIPDARVKFPYFVNIYGYDPNPDELLSMTISGLPPGLSTIPCSASSNPAGTRLTCGIKGTPKPPFKNYPVKISLRDGVNPPVILSLPLHVVR